MLAGQQDTHEFQAQLQQLDALLHGLEHIPDPAIQSQLRAVLSAVLDVHGAGLQRMLEHLDAQEAGGKILDAWARDDIVSGLLLLHGLHPLSLEARVQLALEEVRPALRLHGGNVELLGISEGVVRLRLLGNCHGCPSSTVTMKQTIEEALVSKAPDAVALEVEGVEAAPVPAANGHGRIPLPIL